MKNKLNRVLNSDLRVIIWAMFMIGVIGRALPYGYSDWNFVFENLIWMAFELLFTFNIVNKIISKNNKKLEVKREFSEYYSIAETELDRLVRNLKQLAIKIAAAEVPNKDEELSLKLEDISKNPENYFTAENITRQIVLLGDVTSDFKAYRKLTSYAERLPEFGEEIFSLVNGHLDLYMKFIPLGLLRELLTIREDIQDTPWMNLYVKRSLTPRSKLSESGEQITFKDINYQAMAENVLMKYFEKLYKSIKNIEDYIQGNKEKIS